VDTMVARRVEACAIRPAEFRIAGRPLHRIHRRRAARAARHSDDRRPNISKPSRLAAGSRLPSAGAARCQFHRRGSEDRVLQ
jgi:hypothetical protein